ncbi:voltage-gated potassium channel [Aureococcus anophagefferens]|nr:voltage-gated potassium channel [Aureococcus anophagefferens]
MVLPKRKKENHGALGHKKNKVVPVQGKVGAQRRGSTSRSSMRTLEAHRRSSVIMESTLASTKLSGAHKDDFAKAAEAVRSYRRTQMTLFRDQPRLADIQGDGGEEEDDDDDEEENDGDLPFLIIHPTCDPKIYWDLYVSICIVWSTMSVPYGIGFGVMASMKCLPGLFIIDSIVDLSFMVDITLCFFTAYRDPLTGRLETSRSAIAKRYMKFPSGAFFVDFASTFPLDFIQKGGDVNLPCDGESNEGSAGSPALRILKMLRIVRVAKLAKLAKLLKLKNAKGKDEDAAMKTTIHPAFGSVSRLLLQLFFIGHWVACARHYLTLSGPTSNWKTVMEGDRGEKFALKGHAYLVSMYWVFTTMTTVGYGDVPVVGDREKLLAIFAMIVGGACFGYIMGTITSMLENFDQSQTLFRERVDQIKDYVYDRQFPPVLSTKIVRHVKYVYTKHTCFDTDRIYPSIPTGLRYDLIHMIHADLIKSASFLRDSPRPFAAIVAPKMIPIHAPDGEFVFFDGEVATHLMCVFAGAARAVCRLDAEDRGKHEGRRTLDVRDYAPGDLIGAPALLLTSTYNVNCVAVEPADLYMLPKEDLLDALAEFPDVHRRLYRAAVKEHKDIAVLATGGNPDDAQSPGADLKQAAETLVGSPRWVEQQASLRGLAAEAAAAADAGSKVARSSLHLLHPAKFSLVYPVTSLPPPDQSTPREPGKKRKGGVSGDDDESDEDDDEDDPSVVKKRGRGTLAVMRAAASPSRCSPALAPRGVGGPDARRRRGEPRRRPVAVERGHGRGRRGRAEPGSAASPAVAKSPLDLKVKFSMAAKNAAAKSALLKSFSSGGFKSFDQADEEPEAPVNMTPGELWRAKRVLHPEAKPKIGWDLFVCVLIIYSVLDAIYRMCFLVQAAGAWLAIEWCITSAFGLDFLINFNTAYMKEMTLVYDRRRIARHYSKGWMFIDVMSTVPFSKIVTGYPLLSQLKILKGLRLPLVIMLFAAHIFASVFFLLGIKYERCPKKASWVDNVCLWKADDLCSSGTSFDPDYKECRAAVYANNATAPPSPAPEDDACGGCSGKRIREADLYTKYITSLYWAVATMTTVGYGDVGPSTEHRGGMIMVIVAQVTGTMLFAYVVGIMIDIITNLDPIDRQRRQDLEVIREYIKDRQLPEAIGKALLHNHDWHVQFGSVFDEPALLCVLPPHPAAFTVNQRVNHPRFNCREFHMIIDGAVLVTDRFKTELNGVTKAKLDAECTPQLLSKRDHFGFATIFMDASVDFVVNVEVVATAVTHTLFLNRDAWDALEGTYKALTHHVEALAASPADMERWLYVPPAHRDERELAEKAEAARLAEEHADSVASGDGDDRGVEMGAVAPAPVEPAAHRTGAAVLSPLGAAAPVVSPEAPAAAEEEKPAEPAAAEPDADGRATPPADDDASIVQLPADEEVAGAASAE